MVLLIVAEATRAPGLLALYFVKGIWVCTDDINYSKAIVLLFVSLFSLWHTAVEFFLVVAHQNVVVAIHMQSISAASSDWLPLLFYCCLMIGGPSSNWNYAISTKMSIFSSRAAYCWFKEGLYAGMASDWNPRVCSTDRENSSRLIVGWRYRILLRWPLCGISQIRAPITCSAQDRLHNSFWQIVVVTLKGAWKLNHFRLPGIAK